VAALGLVRQDRAGALGEPEFVLLDEFLAVEDEPTRYRVDPLWPVGGRIVAAAQYKAGKTTLRDNIVRALVDKEDFLGAFPVAPPDGRVAIIDDELDEAMLRRWLREQGIVNAGRVAVLPLRGKVGSFDLRDRAVRARWATKLRAVEAGVVLFDCLRPVLDALGLSEDKEAGRFLVHFDALLDEAGLSEGLVVHHMGHNGERSRGDSRILDWPDATWTLVRERGEDGETAADARRYFAAYGRDVDVPEGLLTFDRERRRLTLSGGTRRETAADGVLPDILDFLTK
jgi:AAA domain